MEPIVVTGLGAVTPMGLGAPTLFERWRDGECGLEDGMGHCGDYHPEEHLSRKEIRATDRFTQLALVAAQEAIEQAGWEQRPPCPSERIGCVIGTGIGGLLALEQEIDTFRALGPTRVSPTGITRFMSNAVAASIALKHGWEGESYALVAACSGGVQAIGAGLRMLESGAVDAVAVGGSDAGYTDYTRAAFTIMGAVSATGSCCPYDRRRDGFVFGEGAGVILLERESIARARGAQVLARVRGYASTADAHHMATPPPDGRGLVRALRGALRSGGIAAGDIDYINPHGASSPLGDRVETIAIKEVLGEQAFAVPVSSTKSAIGHLMGAAGAVEAISAIEAIRHGSAPPTLGLQEPDPELDLWYVPERAAAIADRSAKGYRLALAFSFGLGGHNSAIGFATS